MRINIATVLAVIFLILLTGCSSTKLIPYVPTETMSVRESTTILVDLTKKLSDVDIVINENHIVWGEVNDRVFFDSITSVAIYRKGRFFRNYYVYIFSKDLDKYAIWTKNLSEAEAYVKALQSLISANKKLNQLERSKPANLSDSASNLTQKLRDLQKLRDDGLITDEEYQKKKKQFLDNL